MSEVIGNYEVEENDENGIAMMNAERPAVTIESPRRTMQRRGQKMVEVEEPAYVKFSTEFKSELGDLDVYSLKVLIYIGLSIGYETGTAFPGVRKIAKETKMNKGTVVKAIDELEAKGFLQVWRREGGSNTYKPALYFAIGDGVPRNRTVDELSDEDAELYGENDKLYGGGRVKDAQQDKQELTRVPLSIENQIYASTEPVTTITEKEQKLREYQDRANLIDFQSAGAGALAYAFMVARGILLSEDGVKKHRKAAAEMLKMKVTPEHVTAATKQLMSARDRNGNPITIVDLMSIKNTAIGLANPAPDIIGAVVQAVQNITEQPGQEWRSSLPL